MGIIFFTSFFEIKYLITILAILAGLLVISTKNPIISVFNLIVLYILVAFYLIHIGIIYLGISYIVVYIGAIAILFLFVIMMIDIEVVERKNNNYLILLFFLFGSFILTIKNILYNIGILKINNFFHKEEIKQHTDFENDILYNYITNLNNNQVNILTKPISISYSNRHITDRIINEYNNLIEINNITKWLEEMEANYKINEDLLIKTLNSSIYSYYKNYLLIIPDWDTAMKSVSQISSVGEVLYSSYNIYIYIVSVILLLAMLGAIILTTDHKLEVKYLTVVKNEKKSNNIAGPVVELIKYFNNKFSNIKFNKLIFENNINDLNLKFSGIFLLGIMPFYDNINVVHSENILGSLHFYIISNIVIGLLLLFVNSYFSLSIKYLDKGGGFECGFTSFLQTRERYNVVFYRVSLLFLVFDLEIILAFPFPAIYQKEENIGKNTILVFLFILFVGFIYELKEGALNIVKPAHNINVRVIEK